MTQDDINLFAYCRTGGRSVNGYLSLYSKYILMTKETLECAKEIENNIQKISYLKEIFENENPLKNGIYFGFEKYTGCHSSTDIYIPIDDFFSKEELIQRLDTRISELQKELESL